MRTGDARWWGCLLAGLAASAATGLREVRLNPDSPMARELLAQHPTAYMKMIVTGIVVGLGIHALILRAPISRELQANSSPRNALMQVSSMSQAFVQWGTRHLWLTFGAFIILDGVTHYLVRCAGVPEKHALSYVLYLLRIAFLIPLPVGVADGVENQPRRIGLYVLTLTALMAYSWVGHLTFTRMCDTRMTGSSG